jgi:hypothetical protein
LEETALFSLAIKAIERLSTGGEKKKATNGREQKLTEPNREKTGKAYRGDRERITQKKNKETEKERKSRGTTQRRGSAPPSSLSLHLRTEGDRI